MVSEKVSVFTKGLLMGICDIIPGISGGTVAFITGIYERLIESVKAISPRLIRDGYLYATRRDRRSQRVLACRLRRLDLGFLLILISGILSAIFLMSRLMEYLLANHFAYTKSFFIGLILASSKIIFDNIENHKAANIATGLTGLIFGASLSFIVPARVIEPSLAYVFLGGFLAISAMFLPGISGAFILLILGLYEFILEAIGRLHEHVVYLAVFAAGAVVGTFSISRLISYLFKRNKCRTLYFLLGLVFGNLLIPIRRIYSETVMTYSTFGMILCITVLGMISVMVVRSLERKKA